MKREREDDNTNDSTQSNQVISSETKSGDEVKAKKKKTIHSFMEYPGGDWVVDASRAEGIVHDILSSLKIEKSAKIFLPGVGLSSLPIALHNTGYHCLTLADIEEGSISKQEKDFQNIDSKIDIYKCDVLSGGFSFLDDQSVDVIVDKGFMDVFLRQGSSQIVFAELLRILKPNGIYISLSIFHSKWKRVLGKSHFSSVGYSGLPVVKFSRTRPSVRSFANSSALFVAMDRSDNKKSRQSGTSKPRFPMEFQDEGTSRVLVDFHKVKASEFPNDASLV